MLLVILIWSSWGEVSMYFFLVQDVHEALAIRKLNHFRKICLWVCWGHRAIQVCIAPRAPSAPLWPAARGPSHPEGAHDTWPHFNLCSLDLRCRPGPEHPDRGH